MEEVKEYPPVLTKRDFVRRYEAGEFGNRAITWDSLEDLCKDDYQGGLVHLRCRIPGGPTFYNLHRLEAIHQWTKMAWGERRDYYCSAMAPHNCNLLQGECIGTGKDFTMLCTSVLDLPMRDALAKSSSYLYGISALHRLRRAMNDKSWEWYETLVDRYPEHVIEFSTFSKCWGTLPGYNTVFWEVRKY